jgi:hypothetical protein
MLWCAMIGLAAVEVGADESKPAWGASGRSFDHAVDSSAREWRTVTARNPIAQASLRSLECGFFRADHRPHGARVDAQRDE